MSVFTVNQGMWVYDSLSLFRSPKYIESCRETGGGGRAHVVEDRSKGALLRLFHGRCPFDLETALDAADHGAVISIISESKA